MLFDYSISVTNKRSFRYECINLIKYLYILKENANNETIMLKQKYDEATLENTGDFNYPSSNHYYLNIKSSLHGIVKKHPTLQKRF